MINISILICVVPRKGIYSGIYLDVTVRLGSKYASVVINLISRSATELHSKTTKINKIFIGIYLFFFKLVQKLRNNKSSSFGGPLWLHTKTNSCQTNHLHRLSCLYLMSLMHKKELLTISCLVQVTETL